jgi:predicted choloylglycine hydrolase
MMLWAGSGPHRREFREILLEGTGYERGLQHGRELRGEIAEIVTLWKANTAAVTNRNADDVLRDFFAYAQFGDTIRSVTPDLYDEVRGIADRSGQALKDILVLNLLDEFWIYVDRHENHHCSSIGVPASPGRPAWVAQNMDLEKYTDGFQVLVRIPREGRRPEQLILSHPGLLGLNGMNETGVAVCVNAMMDLTASNRGLPVAFVIRRLVGSTNKEEILRFIRGVRHASGQNYVVGIGGEVFDFEVSANKVVQFKPENSHGAVYHTNHAIVNEDVKSPSEGSSESSRNSSARLQAVAKRLTTSDPVGEETVKDALRSKDDAAYPVCRENLQDQSFFTFASVIMTLSSKPFLQVTFGPPDESQYMKVHFSKHPD